VRLFFIPYEMKPVPLNAIACRHWLTPVGVLIQACVAHHSAYPHSRSAPNLPPLPPLRGEIIGVAERHPMSAWLALVGVTHMIARWGKR